MTTRTRYFVITSLLVLAVGLGTGLVAYYVGFPAGAFAQRAAVPTSSRYVPRDAAVVAYADVREIMTSEVRQKLRQRHARADGTASSEFEDQTGINIETDIDRVVACLAARRAGAARRARAWSLARGRFNDVKIEALMREHGAEVEDYNGKRLIAGDAATSARSNPATIDLAARSSSRGSSRSAATEAGSRRDRSAQTGDNPQAAAERHRQRRADEPRAVARDRQRVGGRPVRRAARPRRSLPPGSRDAAAGRSPGFRSAATSTAGSAASSAPTRATTKPPTTCATSSAASSRSPSCRRAAARNCRR